MVDAPTLVQALNVASDGILLTDYQQSDNPIVFVNAAFENLTGYKKEEILNQNCRFLQGNDRNQPAIQVIKQAILEGRPCRVQIRNYKKNGTLFWNELSIAPLFNDKGQITHFVGIQKNITKQKMLEEALYSEARHDPLTLLYNRRGLYMEARRAVLLARRLKINLNFVMIDIDNFKNINDFYGHAAGDDILVAFAMVLKECQRETDILARYGGDEFLIVLFESDNYSYEKWYSRLVHQLSTIQNKNIVPCPFSISAGKTTLLPFECKSLLALIREADSAMYEEKKKKKLLT